MSVNKNLSQNSENKSLPKRIFPILGIIGLLLIAYTLFTLYQDYNRVIPETKELEELTKEPVLYNFNPNTDTPDQLEFKLTGTADVYRGLILSNIKTSDKYPGVIESGTVKNIGKSDLEIKYLGVNGAYNDPDGVSKIGMYSGFFVVQGHNMSFGQFAPPLPLKRGESINVQFQFFEEKGKIIYVPRAGKDKPDFVMLDGTVTEKGIGNVVSMIKSVSN